MLKIVEVMKTSIIINPSMQWTKTCFHCMQIKNYEDIFYQIGDSILFTLLEHLSCHHVLN